MRVYITMIFLGLSFLASSQHSCHALVNWDLVHELSREARAQSNSRDYEEQRPMIRLALHRVMRTNGSGGYSWADIRQVVDGIDVYYSAFDICFTVVGENEIRDDDFFDIENDESPDYVPLLGTARVENAINLYFVPTYDGGRATGFVFDSNPDIPTYPTVILGDDFDRPFTPTFNAEILAHEIGHCLGLIHTHAASNLCFEEIPRTGTLANCDFCGDLFCDTPADFALQFDTDIIDESNCTYTGNRMRNGFTYAPDVRNIMSYTRPSCMQYFSQEQGNQMRYFLLNSTYLDDYVIPEWRALSGVIDGNSYYAVETSLYSTAEHTGGTHSYEAGSQIDLQPGFSVTATSTNSFSAQIADYSCSTPLVHNHARLQQPEVEETASVKIPARLFPNPTRTQSTLRYELKEDAQVRISVVDVLGQENILLNSNQAAGTQELSIDLSDYPAGLYYCRLMVDGEQQSLPLRIQR